MPDDAERTRLAREALARAKEDARARGSRPGRPGGRRAEHPAAGNRSISEANDSLEGPAARPGGALGDSTRGRPDAGDGSPAGPPSTPASRSRQPRPGRRARRDDPEPLNVAIGDLMHAQGWQEAAAGGSVASRWAEIVGPDLAAHTRPDSLADGELTVTADSTAWATQLRLLAGQLVRRLNAELGDGMVRQVRVRGPVSAAGPARRPGQWRVRGGRGPRDTYG